MSIGARAAVERLASCVVSSQSFEQIGLARAAAVHEAEHAIELLHVPTARDGRSGESSRKCL